MNFINIHFKSEQLGQFLKQKNAAMLHFVYNSKIVCVLVNHSVEEGIFVIQTPYYPPIEQVSDFTTARCEQIILDTVGQKFDCNVLGVGCWQMDSIVAS